ncbi:MAG: hypothetical protein OXB88_00345 [Bacteriovoracales bacterium]|nr:hypothetical protein [Bacteriovoracales bacterium]
MRNRKLTQAEWKRLGNRFLSEIAKSATRGRGGAQRAADALGVSKQRISGMRTKEAVGDKIIWIRMLFLKLGLSDAEARKMLEHPNLFIKKIDSPSILDETFESLKNLYTENELIGWFKLLLSKRRVEKDLKISVRVVDKASSSKKTSKKK